MQLLSQDATPTKAKSILTRRYRAALGLVALLAIIGQVLIQFALYAQANDGRIINIAGRQRMYSQRIAKAALAAQNADTVEEQWRYFEDLQRTALDFEHSHEGLQRGDAGLELPGSNSADVAHMFSEMEPYYQALYTSAIALYEEWAAREEQAPGGGVLNLSPEAKEHVARIQVNERAFLPRMNDLVFQYEKEAHARVGWLRWTELILLMTTLVVLLLEALFVFRPAVEKAYNALGAVLSVNDRLKQTNSELRVAQERAQEAIRVKSAFLANMSHELRTPLSGVLGMISLLLETPLDAKQVAFARTIRMGGESTLEIINEVLSFSRLESGAIELEQAPVSLNACIEEALAVVATQAAWKKIELTSFVEEHVPNLVIGDTARLIQVLTHLVSNAVKFTHAGGVAVTVESEPVGEAPHQVQFQIRDTGIGIAEHDVANLFKPFHQADTSATRKYGGTGLGLAICKKLIEAMGGQIWVESTLGQGSTFHFTLPVQPVAVDEADVQGSDASGLVGKRVLLVDGNPTSRSLLARQLTAWQIEVRTASALYEAVAYIEAGEQHDLCIANEETLGMDGLALVRKLRALAPAHDLPLVLLHAPGRAPADLDLPLTTALAKPVRRALLRLALGRFTAKHASLRACQGRDARCCRCRPRRRTRWLHAPRPPGRRQPDQPRGGPANSKAPRPPDRRRRKRFGSSKSREAAHVRCRADGRPDAGDGRAGSYRAHPGRPLPGRAPVDYCGNGQRAARGPGPLPQSRHGRLRCQADYAGDAAADAGAGAPLALGSPASLTSVCPRRRASGPAAPCRKSRHALSDAGQAAHLSPYSAPPGSALHRSTRGSPLQQSATRPQAVANL